MEDKGDKDIAEIDGINLKAGVSNIGRSMDIYISILKTYYKETMTKANELHEIIENKNIQLFTTYVHGLKVQVPA